MVRSMRTAIIIINPFGEGGLLLSQIAIPYGTTHIDIEIDANRLNGILISQMSRYNPMAMPSQLVEQALEHPVGSPKLCELARGKKKVTIIASDHTRPVPSRILMPLMLGEIRQGNPAADITILIATGCHRNTTKAELTDKFGEEIIAKEKIVIHDCDDDQNMIPLGMLPSGGKLLLNRCAAESDLLIAEGLIEPHFFAGFSGGRKSVLPGVAARKTIMYNHNANFIDNPNARAGILAGNPIHEDMSYAARVANLAFIANVVINDEKKIIYAVAGDFEQAHFEGCRFLSNQCCVQRKPADIVITSNGGYPLDQNIYQAVKGITTAAATVNKNGVIIMFAKSDDGAGAEGFYRTFQQEKSLERILARFRATPKEETIPDQWQSQIFAMILQYATVIYLSDAPDTMVREFHMVPAHSFAEAMEKALTILKKSHASVTVIPDGVSVIVT
jgi:nickel-dependent lactate racemase